LGTLIFWERKRSCLNSHRVEEGNYKMGFPFLSFDMVHSVPGAAIGSDSFVFSSYGLIICTVGGHKSKRNALSTEFKRFSTLFKAL